MDERSVGSTGDRGLFFRRSGRAAWQTVPVNGAFFSSYSAGVNMLIADKVALIGKEGRDRLFVLSICLRTVHALSAPG